MSMPVSALEVAMTPATSPSPISMMRAPASRTFAIRSEWRGRSRMQTTRSAISAFLARARFFKFSAGAASRSTTPSGSPPPTAILSIYTSGALRKPPSSAIAKTASALAPPLAVIVVPSSGSSAMSILGPCPVPTVSPIYSIGASSRSPSPITTVPSIDRLFSACRIASTAAWSAAFSSPRPISREADNAASSVTRTASSARLRSILELSATASSLEARQKSSMRIMRGGSSTEPSAVIRSIARCIAASAFQHDSPDKIAFGDDRVEDTLDRGDRRLARHHAGMDALFEPVIGQPRNAEQLDAVAEFLGEIDVEPRDVADPLGIDAAEIDRAAKGDAREDRELVRGIDTVDVEAWIGFGITELLRLGEDLGKFAAGLAHRRQDVVRGAVEDAVDARQAIAGEALAQRLYDRDAARHRSLESERDAGLLGLRGEPGAVLRHQRLVGGDDVLFMLERAVDDVERDALGAADQLDDDIDLRIGGHRRRILVPASGRQIDAAVAPPVARRYRGDDDAASGAGRQELRLARQQLEGASTDRAEPSHGNFQGRLHENGPIRVIIMAAAEPRRDRPSRRHPPAPPRPEPYPPVCPRPAMPPPRPGRAQARRDSRRAARRRERLAPPARHNR